MTKITALIKSAAIPMEKSMTFVSVSIFNRLTLPKRILARKDPKISFSLSPDTQNL